MNREIKFRGKTKERQWVYGDLLHIAGGSLIYYGSDTNCDESKDDRIAIGLYHDEVSVVNPSTVGQFTGLTDADGREIYEGDILFMGCDNGENIYNEVGIKDGCFGYIGEVTGELIPFCNHDVTEIIAGNIHDNPELREGGNQ